MKNIMKLVLVVSLLALVVAAFAGCQIGGGQTTTPTPECQHSWKPATCLEAAYCRLCGEKIGEALGHDVQPLPAVAPTCTETGLTEGSHCARCKEVYTAQEEVPSLGGHTYEGTTCTACGDVLAHVVVYLSNAANWNEVYVYTWGDNGSEAEWPGTKVEADENGVYSYTLITAYYNKVIFNNGAGDQTADLDIPADENVLFDNVTDAWRHLECTFVDATCEAPKTCTGCGYTIGEALGHDIVVDEAVAPTCDATGLTAGEHCTRCDHVVAQEEVPALGHDLVDVEAKANTCTEDGYTAHKACSRCDYKEGYEVVAAAHALKHTITLPTLTTAGHTTVSCEACDEFETITFGEVSAMGMGTYVLDASDEGLAGTVAGAYADGDVYVHGGVFEMHLSKKFKVDGSKKTFPDGNDTYLETRLNYGGKTQFKANGSIINGIVFTTTHTSTVKIYWVQGGDDHRQVALYNLAGEIVVSSDNQDAAKNDPCYNEFTVPAGTYVLGNVTNTNYHFRVEVVVAHNLVDVEAKANTCTEDGYTAHKACDCGYTEGKEVLEATGHSYVDGICGNCGAIDPDHYFVVTIPEALEAADGHKVEVSGTVSAINTAWSDSYGNISVTIVDAEGNELYIYRMKTNVALGDIITVKGAMGTYNGRQIAAGSTATITGHDSSYDYVEVTVEEAIAADDNTNIIVTGTVVKINTAYSSSYKNISVTIADDNGTQLYVYRLSGGSDLAVGDIITIKGSMATYNGSRQITGGTYTTVGTHTCSNYSEATCTNLAACVVCGATTGELANHNYVDGACTVCGAGEGVVVHTESLSVAASAGAFDSSAKTITWTSANFTLVNAQASSSSAIRTSDSDHFRAYAKSETTISGSKITKVVITCTSSSYATACANSLTTTGVTAVVSGSTVTITVDEGTVDSIVIGATAQWRFNNVEVTYQE